MLLINKPKGPTSHDIVDEVRKITGIKKVGHAGTLDPFAEGLLIILVGRPETKQQSTFIGMDKEYEATFILGEERDTGDITGEPVESQHTSVDNAVPVTEQELQAVLEKFTGEMEQIPSTYSAKKIKGKKAYELAREGKEVKLKPKKVTIYKLELLSYSWPEVKIRVKVSSGTYIRALARDIGRELKTGAYVSELKRTSIGEYSLEDARPLSSFRDWI
ncbi:MAG: tRNA pseudouridine(55) synthase TruB [Candidatus Spechtbacterales bacterium]|nr:tRNA pseudouridine(55) synthase TruB [Candidatus Spechtbacterales bacterium]